MRAIVSMGKGSVDATSWEDAVNYIATALIRCDVQEDIVSELQERLRGSPKWENETSSAERLKECIISEVTRLMDTQNRAFVPVRGQSRVVLVAGHRGAGKTTTCINYASFFRSKGFKTGIVWTSVRSHPGRTFMCKL